MTQTQSHERTADDIINAWNDGDLSIDDADEVTDVDGFTIQAHFNCEDGSVILTYSLKEELSYKPGPEGETSTQFNILEE